MSSTDYLHLNDHKIFNVLRSTLPTQFKKAQNILTVKDDMLYTWDFQDNCVLALNIKAARSRVGDQVFYQTLLPTKPPLFVPELLLVNDSNTLLIVAGLRGVLVFELPQRCPPYGAFASNKEIVYCRSFSLHERVLAFSTDLEVRQVRFHPGSVKNNHIVILTSDNTLRLCKIENSVAIALGIYFIGEQPKGKFPGTKSFYLEEIGETAVDFDFAPPELKEKSMKATEFINDRKFYKNAIESSKTNVSIHNNLALPNNKDEKAGLMELEWPILILHGDGCVYMTSLDVEQKCSPNVKGPLPRIPSRPDMVFGKDYCSILCIPSTPPVVCVAHCNGTISHAILMTTDIRRQDCEVDEDHPYKYYVADKALYAFETIEVELGLATSMTTVEHCCPLFLHRDLSKLGSYYATHETGIHSVTINCIDEMHKFLNNEDNDDSAVDILKQISSAEYIVCTKTSSSDKINPIVGFSLYYDPMSLLALVGNGQLVTLAVVSLPLLPSAEELEKDHMEAMNSPLKQMLSNPFDAHIQKILKKTSSHPILKLSGSTECTQQDKYDLLQRAAQVFKEQHFKQIEQAQEEIEKRVKALKMLKTYQKNEIERMNSEKQSLQEMAENLAEKYEDIKDKQEELTKRCEKILILLSRKQPEPSIAEKKFIDQLKIAGEKTKKYSRAITVLKNKHKYQEVQMQNWSENNNKEDILDEVQTKTIKSNLQDMTNKITNMIKEIHEYKSQLNIK